MPSYLVGAMMSAYPLLGFCYYFNNEFTIGIKKESVFPLPVSERQSISSLYRLLLKVYDCTLVGF